MPRAVPKRRTPASRVTGAAIETGRQVGRSFRVGFGCLTAWGAWTDSGMQGGPVDELLDVAVQRPALDQLEVEVGRTLEDRVQPGLTGDHREERHLDAVDETGAHQGPVHRQAAVRAERHLGLLLEPSDDVDCVAAHDGRVRPVEGSSSVVDTTVAGRLLIRVTHGSRTSESSVLEASIRANARYVFAPKTIAAPRRTRQGGGRAARGLAYPSTRSSWRWRRRSRQGWRRRRRCR